MSRTSKNDLAPIKQAENCFPTKMRADLDGVVDEYIVPESLPGLENVRFVGRFCAHIRLAYNRRFYLKRIDLTDETFHFSPFFYSFLFHEAVVRSAIFITAKGLEDLYWLSLGGLSPMPNYSQFILKSSLQCNTIQMNALTSYYHQGLRQIYDMNLLVDDRVRSLECLPGAVFRECEIIFQSDWYTVLSLPLRGFSSSPERTRLHLSHEFLKSGIYGETTFDTINYLTCSDDQLDIKLLSSLYLGSKNQIKKVVTSDFFNELLFEDEQNNSFHLRNESAPLCNVVVTDVWDLSDFFLTEKNISQFVELLLHLRFDQHVVFNKGIRLPELVLDCYEDREKIRKVLADTRTAAQFQNVLLQAQKFFKVQKSYPVLATAEQFKRDVLSEHSNPHVNYQGKKIDGDVFFQKGSVVKNSLSCRNTEFNGIFDFTGLSLPRLIGRDCKIDLRGALFKKKIVIDQETNWQIFAGEMIWPIYLPVVYRFSVNHGGMKRQVEVEWSVSQFCHAIFTAYKEYFKGSEQGYLHKVEGYSGAKLQAALRHACDSTGLDNRTKKAIRDAATKEYIKQLAIKQHERDEEKRAHDDLKRMADEQRHSDLDFIKSRQQAQDTQHAASEDAVALTVTTEEVVGQAVSLLTAFINEVYQCGFSQDLCEQVIKAYSILQNHHQDDRLLALNAKLKDNVYPRFLRHLLQNQMIGSTHEVVPSLQDVWVFQLLKTASVINDEKSWQGSMGLNDAANASSLLFSCVGNRSDQLIRCCLQHWGRCDLLMLDKAGCVDHGIAAQALMDVKKMDADVSAQIKIEKQLFITGLIEAQQYELAWFEISAYQAAFDMDLSERQPWEKLQAVYLQKYSEAVCEINDSKSLQGQKYQAWQLFYQFIKSHQLQKYNTFGGIFMNIDAITQRLIDAVFNYHLMRDWVSILSSDNMRRIPHDLLSRLLELLEGGVGRQSVVATGVAEIADWEARLLAYQSRGPFDPKATANTCLLSLVKILTPCLLNNRESSKRFSVTRIAQFERAIYQVERGILLLDEALLPCFSYAQLKKPASKTAEMLNLVVLADDGDHKDVISNPRVNRFKYQFLLAIQEKRLSLNERLQGASGARGQLASSHYSFRENTPEVVLSAFDEMIDFLKTVHEKIAAGLSWQQSLEDPAAVKSDAIKKEAGKGFDSDCVQKARSALLVNRGIYVRLMSDFVEWEPKSSSQPAAARQFSPVF